MQQFFYFQKQCQKKLSLPHFFTHLITDSDHESPIKSPDVHSNPGICSSKQLYSPCFLSTFVFPALRSQLHLPRHGNHPLSSWTTHPSDRCLTSRMHATFRPRPSFYASASFTPRPSQGRASWPACPFQLAALICIQVHAPHAHATQAHPSCAHNSRRISTSLTPAFLSPTPLRFTLTTQVCSREECKAKIYPNNPTWHRTDRSSVPIAQDFKREVLWNTRTILTAQMVRLKVTHPHKRAITTFSFPLEANSRLEFDVTEKVDIFLNFDEYKNRFSRSKVDFYSLLKRRRRFGIEGRKVGEAVSIFSSLWHNLVFSAQGVYWE